MRYLVLGHSMAQVEDWRKVNRIPAKDVFYAVNAQAVDRAPRDCSVVRLWTFDPLTPDDRREEVDRAVLERFGHRGLPVSFDLLAAMYRARKEATPAQLEKIRTGWQGEWMAKARASNEGMDAALAWLNNLMGWTTDA